MSSYCLKCRKQTGSSGERSITSATGRQMLQSTCSACGTKKSKFVPKGSSQTGAGIESSKFASESYKGQKKRADEIDGYKLDKSMSSRNVAVYKNDQGQAIVANRGTDLSRKSTRGQDLKNDALIAAGKSGKMDRVKKTVKKNEALSSQGFEVTNVGHSLGGRVAYEASKRTGNAADVFSVGSSPLDRKQSTTNTNITSYRTKNDPVAMNATRLGVKENIISQSSMNPHALSQFVNASGQTGSGRGQYIKPRYMYM